jgi:hypothetical protein
LRPRCARADAPRAWRQELAALKKYNAEMAVKIEEARAARCRQRGGAFAEAPR